MKADFHIHSTVSDGSDTPMQILEKIRENNINVFSLTDHDDCLGCEMIESFLQPGDPLFIPGVELSAEREDENYHILGYAYQSKDSSLSELTKKVHNLRMDKIRERLDTLKSKYAFSFSEEDIAKLLRLPNPGKPHIGNLMIKYGYVSNLSEAFSLYLDSLSTSYHDISPEEAIESILSSHGIPILAHGIYGDGRQYLNEEDFTQRVAYLKDLGLQGLEVYYSKYTKTEQTLVKRICSQFHLLSTAGSDYHGKNKSVLLGQTGIDQIDHEESIQDFLSLCKEHLSQT